MGTSVASASSVEHGPRAQETGDTLQYSRRAPSDVSGGSANSFGQHHATAMVHDIYRKLDQQALEMERQCSEIAELKQKLERVEPRLEQSEMESESWRRRCSLSLFIPFFLSLSEALSQRHSL